MNKTGKKSNLIQAQFGSDSPNVCWCLGFHENHKKTEFCRILTPGFSFVYISNLQELQEKMRTDLPKICILSHADKFFKQPEVTKKLLQNECEFAIFSSEDIALYEPLLADKKLLYISRDDVSTHRLNVVLEAYRRNKETQILHENAVRGFLDNESLMLRAVLSLNQRLGKVDVLDRKGVSRALSETVKSHLGANEVYCWVIHTQRSSLYALDGSLLVDAGRHRAGADAFIPSEITLPIANVVGLAFHERKAINTSWTHDESNGLFCNNPDNPYSHSSAHMIAAPISGPDNRIVAVVNALRLNHLHPFSSNELAILMELGKCVMPYVYPYFNKLAVNSGEDFSRISTLKPGVFREEAWQEYESEDDKFGEILQNSPGWTKWTYGILIVGLVCVSLFTILGKIKDYAHGVAIVWSAEQQDVTVTRSGTVKDINVKTNQSVKHGDVLLDFYNEEEVAQYEQNERKFNVLLRQRLRDPADVNIFSALVEARTQLHLSRVQLETRIVRANKTGIVGDIRVQSGQHVTPGQTVMTLSRDLSQRHVVGILPASFRPRLKAGQTMRLQLDGFVEYVHLKVVSISEDAIDFSTAKSYLNIKITDPSIGPEEAVVIVSSEPVSSDFVSGDQRYHYHAGMRGVVDVAVAKEPIIFTLVPGLKKFIARLDDKDKL